MSEMSADRSLNFSSKTLSILQRLNWYQINLSLCGLSLKGDFEYLRFAIEIYITKNINGDYNLHCYLKNNLQRKCTFLNNSLIFKNIPKKVNPKEYSDYFNGKHFLNKFNIWESSVPQRKIPQIINLLSPKKKGNCKNPQRTIFLYYPKYLNLSNDLQGFNVNPYKIKNKNMTVYFTYAVTNHYDHPAL